MSGGSYNYAYKRMMEVADEIRPLSPLRKAFKTHLRKVAQACQDIEWVDSSDFGEGDENAAIAMCLRKDDWPIAIDLAISEANRVKAELTDLMEVAQKYCVKQEKA